MFSTQIPLKMPILVKVSPSRQTLEQNMPHMDLEGTMLSEISQPKKDKLLYDITYMWNFKNTTS